MTSPETIKKRWRFSLRGLLIVVTVACILVAAVCGLWRFGQSVVNAVERDYYSQRIREGSLSDPHNTPAAVYLTPEEIDALIDESNSLQDSN